MESFSERAQSVKSVTTTGVNPGSLYNAFASAFVLGDDAFPIADVPLQEIVSRAETGAYRAAPRQVFGFEEIVEAHRALEANEAPGKLVVTI